jgi:hypothetical protein
VVTCPHLPDDEQVMFNERVEALRRLSPARARLLGLIAETMLREAHEGVR